ncbi:FAD/NAD(P)-binding domain-containing protein [Xylariaceae sp. FL1272]|nr:FAD/NAD(P)-binding domain-containing protein [Xylariaceae sp. FL1272]
MGSIPYTDDCRPVGSYPPTGIDVLIVGTGLAGLTASIECIRKGHNVRVLERNDNINTAGDMYFMGHSAIQFFKHWPELLQEYEQISMRDAWLETFKHSGERMIAPMRVSDRLRAAGVDPKMPPGRFEMRPLIYGMFVRQVEKLGVQVQFGKKVVDYQEDAARKKGIVVTDKGETIEADIVIAADGVGSKSQRLVGGQVRARSSGRAMWRAAFPSTQLDQNPTVRDFFGHMLGGNNDEPVIRTFMGPGMYALTLIRPGTCVWIMNHDVTGNEEESWTHTVESGEVLKDIDKGLGPNEPWASIFKELVKLTPPKTILNFELFWRNPQPSWSSPGGRVIQIGDAAHSFLPSSGNGATQAIEDAVSLASCLQIGGKENIPVSVQTHIRFRFIRCACAQKLGFANAELLQDTDWSKAKFDPKHAQPRHPKWVWQHDPESYSYENYHSMAETVNQGVPFDKVHGIPPNYPPGYRYKPWSIDQIMEDIRNGKSVDLGEGNWD